MVDKTFTSENLQSFIGFNLISNVLAEHAALQAMQLKKDMSGRGLTLTTLTLSLLILEKNEWVCRLLLAANNIS